ncbi:MAG: beta-lactamase family protein, partial [Candidatus Latescibacteria bacterium]|nr:beta-lactamase family protein [Candidatus Latescibacterota bacterium]
ILPKKPQHIFSELADMHPTTKLNETFQYQNQMVAAGGYIAAMVYNNDVDYGAAYNQAMRELVFLPLDMKNTTLDFEEVIKRKNIAIPHSSDIWGKQEIIPLEKERTFEYGRPAGSIFSNVLDISNFIITEMNHGIAPSGKRVVSEKNLIYRWQPQVKIDTHYAYGLGWRIGNYKGLQVLSHNGATMGFAANVYFFPDKEIGVVMISNSTRGHSAEYIIYQRLLEFWFGIDNKVEQQLNYSIREKRKMLSDTTNRIESAEKSWLKTFVGKHVNAELGTITITREGDNYQLQIGRYQTEILPYNNVDGRRLIIFVDSPISGFLLYPHNAAKGTFGIYESQHSYIFNKIE